MKAPEAGAPPPDHGTGLTPEDERLLRGTPPPEAIAWCEGAAGGRVVRIEPFRGGTSSAVHGLDLADSRRLVLRRFVRADWLADEPDLAAREATVLGTLQRGAVPAPRLVASDPDGAAAGASAVLMTRLAGTPVWRPRALDPFLHGLAGLLPRIHATEIGDARLPAYAPYATETREPPPGTRRPEVWARGFACFDRPPPEAPRVLIHRDFHPGNVLWSGGAITGVVDWASAAVGVPAADVGHCRWNLARALGLDAADRFLALTGERDYDPYWDVVAVLGGYGAAAMAAKLPAEEEFLARALDRRG